MSSRVVSFNTKYLLVPDPRASESYAPRLAAQSKYAKVSFSDTSLADDILIYCLNAFREAPNVG